MNRRALTIAAVAGMMLAVAAVGAVVMVLASMSAAAPGPSLTPVRIPTLPQSTPPPSPPACSTPLGGIQQSSPGGTITFSGACSFSVSSTVTCSANTDDVFFGATRDGPGGSTFTYQVSAELRSGPGTSTQISELFQVSEGGYFYGWTSQNGVTFDPGQRGGTIDATLPAEVGTITRGTEHISGRFVCS